MDYKKEIIKMIEDMDNEDFLFKIYHYILAKHRRTQIATQEWPLHKTVSEGICYMQMPFSYSKKRKPLPSYFG